MKKIIAAAVSAALLFTACGSGVNLSKYKKFSREFDDLFDMHAVIIGYAENKAEFDGYYNTIYEKVLYMHQLFDIYNNYDGLNNIKTINDNAGIKPVKVDGDLIELLDFALSNTGSGESGVVNVAFGAVLKIWHKYREEGGENPKTAKLPDMDKLIEASRHTAPSDVVVDETEGTVYLKDPEMSLDVGAVAKGYAARKAMEAVIEAGSVSMLINLGGNVVAHGRPLERGKERWTIGIQAPEPSLSISRDTIDTIYVNDAAVVTSGDYQRFYTVGGVSLGHIIDPETLMPAKRYASVTVICQDSAVADLLSTMLFITGINSDSAQTIISQANAEVFCIGHDGTVEMTDGFEKYRN